jgi:hypothetical protein
VIKARDIVAAARETLGTLYWLRGRVSGFAIDCAGVPVHVAKRLGIPLEDFVAYGRLPFPVEMRNQLDKQLMRVPKAEMQIGDIAWIRMRENGETQHLGIVADYHLGGFSLIHAYNGSGLNKVVEHRIDEQWMARIVGVWRYPGVEL